MQADKFVFIFTQSIQFLSQDWKSKFATLLISEHWNIIAERCFSFTIKNEISHNPFPTFNEEILHEYHSHYQYFENLKLKFDKTENELAQEIAKTIEETPIESLLAILGQRKTPATIIDQYGIPPTKDQLLKSCFEPYNSQICKAARARDKHVSRNEKGTFWGEIEGTPQEKEQITKDIVAKIINEYTWWNVFTHYKHDVVFEIRIASGQGIRWKKNNLELIGFLEPFL